MDYLRLHLESKTDQELRNFAFKLNVRLTGPRVELVTRLEVASRDLGRDRIRQVITVSSAAK